MFLTFLFIRKNTFHSLIHAKNSGKTFAQLISNDSDRNVVKDYAEKFHIEELVSFLFAVLQYKKKINMKYTDQFNLFKEILTTYILTGSPLEINIQDEQREQLLQTLFRFDEYENKKILFDNVYNDMESLFWVNMRCHTLTTQFSNERQKSRTKRLGFKKSKTWWKTRRIFVSDT